MDGITSFDHGERFGAVWGTRGAGDRHCAHALLVLAALVLGLLVPAAAAAGNGKGNGKDKASDRTPPTTTITSGPANLSAVAGAITFTFSANEPATFACSLDGSPFGACSTASSFLVVSPVLGQHAFAVRATDTSGNIENGAATVTWYSVYQSSQTYVPRTLLGQAQAHPDQIFDVIVQVPAAIDSEKVASATRAQGRKWRNSDRTRVGNSFTSVNGFEAQLPGWLIVYVAETYPVVSITPNVKVQLDEFNPVQVWPSTIGADKFWPRAGKTCAVDPKTGLQLDPACVPVAPYAAPDAPTIAVVDSGIDGSLPDFGHRVIGHTDLQSVGDVRNADDDGHGTFVATMAAGASASYPGAAPTARLYDVRVIGPDGSASTSDVIAGADWILQHKDEFDIKVANFSLHAGHPNSFRFDPLDKAVEALWFSGVTVVVASGNFGTDLNTPSAMDFAPGNDPFVITVGAADTLNTQTYTDDSLAPWSAWGHTADGFSKPEVSAPGRYMIGAQPPTSTLQTERPDHIVAPGYIQLSGTSFAAPVVAGIAANLIALHPGWTPDQIKGALMATAHPLTLANEAATGAGEVDEARADLMQAPPNANLALDRFVVPAAVGSGSIFDDRAWVAAASADPSWAAQTFTGQSWNDQSTASQSWASQSWASQSWSDQSWASQSWVSSSQADAALADQSWASSSVVD